MLHGRGVRSRRTLRALAVLAVSGSTVLAAGCSVFNPPPGPEDAANTLATGLASGSLASVPLDGATGADATAFLTTAIGDLKDVKRTVAVTSVAKDASNDKAATAKLTWSWDLGGSGLSGSGSGTSSTASPAAVATSTPTGTGSAAAATVWTYTVDARLSLNASDSTWHTTWSPALFAPDLTGTEKLTLTHTQGTRADILGAGGTPLMTQRSVFEIGIDKSRVGAAQATSSAATLAGVLGIDATSYAKRVASAGAKAFVVGLTVREGDALVTSRAGEVSAVAGAASIPAKGILPPTSTFARSLLGSVGEATAEMIAKSNGTIKAGDQVGLSGLELRDNAQLSGKPGFVVSATGTDASGAKVSRALFTQKAADGTPVTLTLEVQTQLAAEQALSTQTSTPTALVVMRPSTGEILAAANGPANAGATTATTGHAAPGSTFKIVTALALLRAGLTPDTVVPCTPTVTVDGRSFKNYDDYPSGKLGDIPLKTAFANSCNTAFISQNAKISQADLASAAESLGIGVDLDLDFPAFLGSVPSTGEGTTHAASMIGQAQIEVAPMDMATVVASVVKGSLVRPELVVDNPAVSSYPKPSTPLTSAEAASLRELMGAVVSEGSGSVLASSGVTLAKTGTAEYGTATPPQTHAWMVAAKGDLAVAAYVETGASGSGTAAPLIKDFLANYSG